MVTEPKPQAQHFELQKESGSKLTIKLQYHRSVKTLHQLTDFHLVILEKAGYLNNE
jgi:hypothetical protein